MSRRSWGRGLLDILRELGVTIDRKAESLVEHEKEVDPTATTEDIVQRLSLAPPEVVQRAVIIATEEGSTEVLSDRFARAKSTMQETARASAQLNDVACAIAAKK